MPNNKIDKYCINIDKRESKFQSKVPAPNPKREW